MEKQTIKEIENSINQATELVSKAIRQFNEIKTDRPIKSNGVSGFYRSIINKRLFFRDKKDIKGETVVMAEWINGTAETLAYSVHLMSEVNDMYEACQTEEGKKWPVRINDLTHVIRISLL